MLLTQAIRGVIAREQQKDVLSPLIQGLSPATEALDQLQGAINSIISYLNAQASSYPVLTIFQNILASPFTLTGSLQDACSQTVQNGGNYVVLAQTVLNYANDDAVYMELDVDGNTQSPTINVQSSVAGFAATLPAGMAWFISASDSSLIELKAKKTSGTGTSAITQATLIIIRVN